MLGRNHFKRKIEKRERKREARKAARLDENLAHKKASRGPHSVVAAVVPGQQRARNASTLKGPVVTAGSRDAANDRRSVPYQSQYENQAHGRGRDGRGRGAMMKAGATPRQGGGSAVSRASSAAQRRRVLRHKSDEALFDYFRQSLHASAFRLLNEEVYNMTSARGADLLRDAATFADYHTGYRQQLVQWPVNPSQLVIDALLGDRRGRFAGNKGKCMPGSIPRSWVVADMGCGEALVAAALQPKGYTVHSFDLCALNDRVTVANTTDVPLEPGSVDVCIFSLSLMATDYERSLFEGFRILKPNRLLKIVEVRSRMPHPRRFAELVEGIGFTLDYQEVACDYFVAFDFLKKDGQKAANRALRHTPGDVLTPSFYKKR